MRGMNRIVVIALATAAALSTESASAQGLVRPGWTASGSAVCPEYYDYFQGWCHPRRGYGYRGYDYRDRREYYRPRGYGRRTVPPRWNYAGSAVCPEYYDYAATVGLCVSRY